MYFNYYINLVQINNEVTVGKPIIHFPKWKTRKGLGKIVIPVKFIDYLRFQTTGFNSMITHKKGLNKYCCEIWKCRYISDGETITENLRFEVKMEEDNYNAGWSYRNEYLSDSPCSLVDKPEFFNNGEIDTSENNLELTKRNMYDLNTINILKKIIKQSTNSELIKAAGKKIDFIAKPRKETVKAWLAVPKKLKNILSETINILRTTEECPGKAVKETLPREQHLR